MARAAFVYEDSLSRHVLRQDHPMRPIRLRHTYELLQSYGAFDNETSLLVTPRPATEEELRHLHGQDYILAVRSLSQGLDVPEPQRFGFSPQGDNPIFPGMYDAATFERWTKAQEVACRTKCKSCGQRIVWGETDRIFDFDNPDGPPWA